MRVRRAAELHPDVAILDIVMPEGSGIAAARRIRETSPSTQVVILSMHSSTTYISDALAAGARAYVLKESAGAELVEAVRAAHLGHSYLSQKVSDQLVAAHASRAEPEKPLACLTSREREILELVVDGKSSKEIGDVLCLSTSTIETSRSRLMRKLGVRNLPSLVKLAIKQGVASLE